MPTIQEALDDLVANTTGLQNTVSGRITDMDGKITQANSAQVAAETAKTNAEIAKTSAQTAQTLAETARDIADTAKADAQSAKSDALAAQSAATNAQSSAESARDASIAADTSASTNKSDSLTAKNAAVVAQVNAETAETNASASSAAANAHKIKAGQWADNAEDAAVETGKYSAKHWSAKAALEKTAAATSETNAGASATAASSSEGVVTTKASEAAASATSASGSASTATAKAAAASSSATAASGSASTATTKASEAAASASNAASSASSAASAATTAVNAVIDTAPSNLNTLNELAAALGDDANHVTTMTNLIGTKLPLTGGTLTGALTATSFHGDGSGLTGISSNLLISSSAPAGAHTNGAEWWEPNSRKLYKWIDQQPNESAGVEEWRDVLSGGASVIIDAGDPLYRVTFTQGYVFGGYRSSSPWRNANRTVHATDVTTNLGDIMDEAGAYCTGGYSDTTAYMFGTDNAYPGTTSRVKKLNMFTETSAGASGNMSCARDDMGEFQDGDGIAGWVHGGGCGNVDKIVWATDTFTNIRGENSDNHQNSNQYGSATGGYGYKSKGSRKMSFITESWSAMGNVVGGQTHSKTLPSKHERMYVENNGNSTEGTGGQVRNYNTTNDTHIGCNSFKPWRGGETNYEIGQDHGYGLGHCGDGCQSNHSFKSFYHTDSHLAGGTTMQPKGHDGMSSAGCGSRSS